MPRVYVAFILDVKIVFNKIINNSRPPTWYFSLTRTGNKEFIIVGLIVATYFTQISSVARTSYLEFLKITTVETIIVYLFAPVFRQY